MSLRQTWQWSWRQTTTELFHFLSYSIVAPTAPALRRQYLLEGEAFMTDANVEQYVREHEERVRRLDELYEKISSPEYNEEEKTNFRYESLKLCIQGLTTV